MVDDPERLGPSDRRRIWRSGLAGVSGGWCSGLRCCRAVGTRPLNGPGEQRRSLALDKGIWGSIWRQRSRPRHGGEYQPEHLKGHRVRSATAADQGDERGPRQRPAQWQAPQRPALRRSGQRPHPRRHDRVPGIGNEPGRRRRWPARRSGSDERCRAPKQEQAETCPAPPPLPHGRAVGRLPHGAGSAEPAPVGENPGHGPRCPAARGRDRRVHSRRRCRTGKSG